MRTKQWLLGMVFAVSATGFAQVPINWGWSEAVPVQGDYDGDGIADIAVYWPPGGNWYIWGSREGFRKTQWGFDRAEPVPADYDGDGITDLAVYVPATGEWIVWGSREGYMKWQWGWDAAWPVPADFDDDGRADPAVYWPEGGNWYILPFATPETTDPNEMDALFANAVLDAHAPSLEKAIAHLTPIHADNPDLIWSNGLLLVATFTRTYDYPENIGKTYTNQFADAWVTVAPEARDFFRSYRGTNVALRFKQLLGMPHTVANDMIAEFWVDPKILFRPSADPEITDCVAEPDFSFTNSGYSAVSDAHYSWYTNQVAVNTWPWTRLGYTYDWGRPHTKRFGLSEFVIPKGSSFIVKSIAPVEEYLRH